MKKSLTIAAIAAFALGAAACHKSGGDESTAANVSAEDNMLVPADENAMMGDSNDMTGNDVTTDNSAMSANSMNAM